MVELGREAFLSYYPLKQGLKPIMSNTKKPVKEIFILLSIKTRIETWKKNLPKQFGVLFLSYYPLKQGLKRGKLTSRKEAKQYFYPTIH